MQDIQENYDLVVLGGGPAGTPVAIEYAKLNTDKKIALIDTLGELGGECLFQGCIPSKIMEASANHIKELASLEDFGVKLEDKHYKLIWDKIKEKKEKILSKRTDAAKDVAYSVGNIDIIKAYGSFESEDSIKLLFKDNSTKQISFKRAVIATGSYANKVHYDGDGVDKIITNEQFFADMVLPKSLGIIGSGAIAIEFTQILATLGVEITLFVRGDKILKNLDEKATEYILKNLQDTKNINLLLQTDILSVDKQDEMLNITYTKNGTTKSIVCEKLLSAIGRKPSIENLSLEKANVTYTKKGISTNDALQTSNKYIFANGDVVDGFPRFAHSAQYSAHIIAQNLFLEHNFFKPDFSKNSWVLFSSPNIAVAGISEKEAKTKGIEVIVDRYNFNIEAKSQIQDKDFGYLEYVVEKSSYKIIGISIVHEDAHTLGGEASLIVSAKLTLKDMINSIHPHPTISEAFVALAKQMMGDIMLKKLSNPILQTLLKIEKAL